MQGQQGELLQSCSHFSVLPIIPPALCFGLLIVSSLGDGEERKLVTLLAIIQLENSLAFGLKRKIVKATNLPPKKPSIFGEA